MESSYKRLSYVCGQNKARTIKYKSQNLENEIDCCEYCQALIMFNTPIKVFYEYYKQEILKK